MATTGLGTTAAVKVTSSNNPVLTLVGEDQLLTTQITAEAVDVAGNVQAGVELYYASNDDSIATVDDTGLVTAVGAGVVTITVAAAFGNNTVNLYTPLGLPWNSVQADVTVEVLYGVPLFPDFSFTLSSDTVTLGTTDQQTITITQIALNGLTNPVTYSFSVNSVDGVGNGYQPSFLSGTATITGTGTATLRFTTYAAVAGTLTGQVNGFAGSQAYAMPPGQNGLSHLQPLTVTVS